MPFFLLFIFFFLVFMFLSKIEIRIEYFILNTETKMKKYLIYVNFKILKKITWARFKINNKKLEKYRNMNSKILKRINCKNKILDIIKLVERNLSLEQINLKSEIGLNDAALTSITIGFISTILSVIFLKLLKKDNKDMCKYRIIPIYENKTQIKVKLNCIISIKLVHIIRMVYILLKKETWDIVWIYRKRKMNLYMKQ